MMIRIYNQGGKVRVTKTCGHLEQTMFSSVEDGECVEVNVEASICTKSSKKRAGSSGSTGREE